MGKQQDHVEVLRRIRDDFPLHDEESAALAAAIYALTLDKAAVERALAAWFALPSQTSDQVRMLAALQAAIHGESQ